MTAAGGGVLAHPVALGFVLVWSDWSGWCSAVRRPPVAVALTVVGVVLSVGVHPFDHLAARPPPRRRR
jgi:hypothetical protein